MDELKDELKGEQDKKPAYIEQGGNKFYPYTAEFNTEEGEVKHTFHFRRPQRTHMVQIAKVGNAKAFDVTGEVLVQLVLPEEAEQLRQVVSDWPLLIPAFADEVMKRSGMGSVFAGK